jgi:hypothetical protein
MLIKHFINLLTDFLIYYSQGSNNNQIIFNDSFESFSSSRYLQEQKSERDEVKIKKIKKMFINP